MWNREPAVLAGLVQSLLALAVAFGLELSSQQVAAVVAATAAVLALAVRQSVTPVHHVGAAPSAPLAEVV